ncbi:MAG: Fe-S cluster assembly protein SufD [Acidobacteriota bacterium]
MSTTTLEKPTTSAAVTPYLTDWEAFTASLGRGEPEALRMLRKEGLERFSSQGFPTLKQEDWRFTDVSAVAQGSFRRATGAVPVTSRALEPFVFDGALRLVFVDGFYSAELSNLIALPEGAYVGSLAEALTEHPDRALEHLGRRARTADNPFVALNTAFLRDGALISLPANAVIEAPIHLLYMSSDAATDSEAIVSYPRNLIVAGENSQATVVETYAGLGPGRYFSCSVTEVVAAPNAVVDHYKVQHESHEAFHLATLQIYQERSSNFFSHSVSTGGALTRNDVNAVLDAEGIECTLNGLYMVTGEQHVDNHMRMDHAKPHCNSYELYKGILDGRSRAVFNGRIYVHPNAQKTDAKQSNRNLLLSEGAIANSQPQLEIFADDVRCTHGSTVGQLDEEAVFYLRSRGIGAEAASSLLTYAFASDIVQRIKVPDVRRDLEEFLFTRLPRGEVVRQAV